MDRLMIRPGILLGVLSLATLAVGDSARFQIDQNPEKGELNVKLDGREAFVYYYEGVRDLPHIYPLNSPSGKNMLVRKTEPWPHHRAFWISDTVERDGVKGDVYNSYYSGVKVGNKEHESPFNAGARHVSFGETSATSGTAHIAQELVWETSRTQTAFPLLTEHRDMKLYALDGAYLIDLSFKLQADFGDVKFISDAVHYSWPYLRLNSTFSGDGGGVITASNGATGQEATNLKPALWMDYSNNVEGTTEGVAMFQWPDGEERKWLTRKYGTFGPRRPEHLSGKPFTLKKGESIAQRVGVLVHKGDVQTGNVAELYDRYTKGEFQ